MRRVDAAAVGFELGFAGTARADAAAQSRHFDAVSGQARQHVVQLGQFDLQLPFTRAGAAGEDIEDQLRAVENFAIEGAFDVALLGGGEFGIEEHEIGGVETRLSERSSSSLPEPISVAASGAGRDWMMSFFDARAGAFGQRLQLLHRFSGVVANFIGAVARARLQLQTDQNGLLSSVDCQIEALFLVRIGGRGGSGKRRQRQGARRPRRGTVLKPPPWRSRA